MGFRINTNIAALNAHTNAVMNNRNLDSSLSKLSSGLRINTAADDSSGMVIADNLRSQANSLGQAISNANDGISIIQTADKAMDEQLKILDTIKTKAIQASSDTQNASSREAIQKDVNRLIEQLDNIAKTTSFNGQTLLSGSFTNKEFQVGAYSNQTIQTSIGNTQSIATGNIATRDNVVQLGNTTTVVSAAKGATTISSTSITGVGVGDTIRIDGVGDYVISAIDGSSAGSVLTLSTSLEKAITGSTTISLVNNVDETLAGMAGLSGGTTLSGGNSDGFAVGDTIKFTDGVSTAVRTVMSIDSQGTLTLSAAVGLTATSTTFESRGTLGTDFAAADYAQYTVEGTKLQGVQITDSSGYGVVNTGLGRIADLINESTAQTGIKAVANVEKNSLIGVAATTLSSDMKINGVVVMESGQSVVAGDSNNSLVDSINQKADLTGVRASLEPDGSLTLKSDGRAMKLEGFTDATGINDGVVAGTMSLSKNGLEVMNVESSHFSDAALTTAATAAAELTEIVQSHTLSEVVSGQKDSNGDGLINNDDEVGLMRTQEGAMLAMDITEAAISELDSVRADLGAVQNQLVVTVNNISVTQVNVKAAESQIRDVDFAAESAAFSKYNILAQSGSYAMSQANAVQQNVLRLLQ